MYEEMWTLPGDSALRNVLQKMDSSVYREHENN